MCHIECTIIPYTTFCTHAFFTIFFDCSFHTIQFLYLHYYIVCHTFNFYRVYRVTLSVCNMFVPLPWSRKFYRREHVIMFASIIINFMPNSSIFCYICFPMIIINSTLHCINPWQTHSCWQRQKKILFYHALKLITVAWFSLFPAF